ncbi:hypothetical protein [Gulosibacter bifidus]|uniref:Uncharacterized protein n=1 Tax=Gulosibacter bifidus TaxID=272239 RepID=A0ABW5RII8_9MICO|nr:hypothetical protein [Gulosibacter bifidus]
MNFNKRFMTALSTLTATDKVWGGEFAELDGYRCLQRFTHIVKEHRLQHSPNDNHGKRMRALHDHHVATTQGHQG